MRKKINKERFYKIRRLSTKGLSRKDIADKMDISVATVARVMLCHNWEDLAVLNKKYAKRVKPVKDCTTEPLFVAPDGGWNIKNPDKVRHELIGLIQDSVDWTLTIERVNKIVDVIINKYEK